MENILILIISVAVLIIAGYSAKAVFWDMRKQRSYNADFLDRFRFRQVHEKKDRLKQIIAAREVRIAFNKLADPSSEMFKLVDCYQTTDKGEAIFFVTVSDFAQPKSLIRSVYFLAPLRQRKKDPFYVRLWSNTYGQGSSVYKSKKRIHAFDFGKTAIMNGRTIFRSADLPDFEHVDFYGPSEEHPENYLGRSILEMVKRCRENGIAEISCLDGVALFRIYSLTGVQKPGNVLTHPEKPYQYLLRFL